jgi:hypothetical protein
MVSLDLEGMVSLVFGAVSHVRSLFTTSSLHQDGLIYVNISDWKQLGDTISMLITLTSHKSMSNLTGTYRSLELLSPDFERNCQKEVTR